MLYSITSQKLLRRLAEGSIAVFVLLVGLFIISAPAPSASAEDAASTGPGSLSLFVDGSSATASTNSSSGFVLLSDTEQLSASSRPATTTLPVSPSRTGKTTIVTLLPGKVGGNY